ncbi:small nuclear ribonucleoprotein Sm D3 [Actinomortierella wolfii]|nr:small nuclear ribonucleoprotein Sm D3 [Actinomortierella wolfii]
MGKGPASHALSVRAQCRGFSVFSPVATNIDQPDQVQEPVSPHIEPRFQYGDVIVLDDGKGDRKLFGPLKKGLTKDNNLGRILHDDLVGLMPMSTIKTHKGAKYTVHWPTLDEYTTRVKRQATIMYPKDATTAVHLLDLFPGAHVLEAGTGNGSMTMYIQRAIQGPGSHLDTVDIRNEHSLQAEQNIERFWRGIYRKGITFWRSSGGLERVIKRLNGSDQGIDHLPMNNADVETETTLTATQLKKKKMESMEKLPPNPHPPGHQYDAISLDLPDCKLVLLDLVPLLKADRPMCLYMVNMSQILDLAKWLRRNCQDLVMERVLEIGWKEWTVRSAAVRSKVKGRVHVGGFGDVSLLPPSSSGEESASASPGYGPDNIPDDALGWVCRPVQMPRGHTGFLVQLPSSNNMSIGVPIKLLHEAQGHIITIELKTGNVYRGTLFEAEDNMNCQLKDITVTARDGRITQLEQVYIRGSHIRFFIVPDMLKNAPMFKQQGQNAMKGKGIGLGRGKATVARAQARGGRGGFRGGRGGDRNRGRPSRD